MPLKALRVDPAYARQLLCRQCGYRIDGLGGEGACPECGERLERSHPSRREGSQWQRRPGPGAWLASGLALLRRPRAFWDRVRVDAWSGKTLAKVNIAAGAALAVGVPSAVQRVNPVAFGLLWFLVFVAVWTLTLIEQLGIRFWGNVHGGRVTRDVAWAVCGHASVGWVVGGVCTAAAWVVVGLTVNTEIRLDVAYTVLVAPARDFALVGGWAVGLLLFETLTYLGVRRMRFANAPRALSERAGG